MQISSSQNTVLVHSDRVTNPENMNPAFWMDLDSLLRISHVTTCVKRHMVFGSFIYNRIMEEECLHFIDHIRVSKLTVVPHTTCQSKKRSPLRKLYYLCWYLEIFSLTKWKKKKSQNFLDFSGSLNKLCKQLKT